jgi:hypothetical protein
MIELLVRRLWSGVWRRFLRCHFPGSLKDEIATDCEITPEWWSVGGEAITVIPLSGIERRNRRGNETSNFAKPPRSSISLPLPTWQAGWLSKQGYGAVKNRFSTFLTFKFNNCQLLKYYKESNTRNWNHGLPVPNKASLLEGSILLTPHPSNWCLCQARQSSHAL